MGMEKDLSSKAMCYLETELAAESQNACKIRYMQSTIERLDFKMVLKLWPREGGVGAAQWLMIDWF